MNITYLCVLMQYKNVSICRHLPGHPELSISNIGSFSIIWMMPPIQEPTTATNINNTSEDERRLAALGYKQELKRSWSGFSNFAISFSVISILSGCFTTFGQAWNNGGPIAISIGWPLISFFILIIG